MFSKKFAALALAGACAFGATASQAYSIYTADQYPTVYSYIYGMVYGMDSYTGAWGYRGEGSGYWYYATPLDGGNHYTYDLLYTYDSSYGWYYTEYLFLQNGY